jgi:putative peptidoglycan lipid II flippase
MTTTSRQTVLVSLLSVVGLVMGFGNSIVVGYYYGASPARDAFLVAQVMPTYVTSVFSGNLALLFIPVFVRYLNQEPARAWRLASGVVSISALALGFVVTLGCVFSLPLVRFLAPTYDPERLRLASELLRILFPSTLLGGISSIVSSLYYSERQYFRPSIAPLVSVLVTLLVNVALHPFLGIHSLAIGTTLGATASLTLLLPRLLKSRNLRFSIDLEPGLGQVFRISVPLFLAGIVYHFNDGFERMISSRLPTGSVSFMGYATQAKAALATVTSTGVARTIVPLLSRAWAENDLVSVRRYFAAGIRAVLMVALPVVVVLWVFGATVVATLYERGAFTPETTKAVTRCLQWLMFSYIAGNLGSIVTNCFYVTQKTMFLAIYTVFETGFYILLAYTFTQYYSYAGLALALSVRDVISVTVYLFFAHRVFKGLGVRRLLGDIAKLCVSAAAFFVVASVVRLGLSQRLPSVVVLLLGASMGGAVYVFLTARVFRIDEAIRLLTLAKTRLR